MDIAVGFTIHTGWAIAVMVAGDQTEPRVLDRRRVTLVPDDLPRQVYHAAQDLPLPQAARLVARVHAAADRTTDDVMTSLTALAAESGELVAIGITGAPREVPDLEKILRSHPLLHLAEGELYRAALCEAAAERGLPVAPISPTHGIAETAEALGVPAGPFAARLAALRAELGPPWQGDHRLATAAALAALDVGR